MLRLLFFMNVMGTTFFLIHTLLCIFERKFMPPKCRVLIYRTNILLFIIPYPAIFYFMRTHFDDILLKVPFAPFMYNGALITVHLGQNISFVLSKPDQLQMLLILLWTAIIFALLIRFFMQQRQLHKFHKNFDLYQENEAINASTNLADLVRKVQKELNLKKTPCIYLLDGMVVPHVTGIFRPKLCLPSSWNVSEQVYYMAIKHELAHIKHMDLLFQRLSLIARIVNWYNPIVYILSSKMSGCDELAADACACDGATREDRIAYGHAVLAFSYVSSNIQHFAVKGFGFKKNSIKLLEERISIMNKNKLQKHKTLKFVAASVMSFVIFSLSAIPTLAYSLPPTLESDNLTVDSIDTFHIDTLPTAEETDPLLISAQPLEDGLHGFLDDLDFSKNDTYCIDENGVVYEVVSPHYSGCNHSFLAARVSHHDKNSNGGCSITTYRAERCSKCGDIFVYERIATTIYDKCPH